MTCDVQEMVKRGKRGKIFSQKMNVAFYARKVATSSFSIQSKSFLHFHFILLKKAAICYRQYPESYSNNQTFD